MEDTESDSSSPGYETEPEPDPEPDPDPETEPQPEPVIVKAAILLFCRTPSRTPSKSCIALLLGKIREKGWVRSAVLHSDFGGRVEETDPDVEYTAAREYYEETLGGQIPLFGMQANDMSIDKIADCLRKKRYFAKITTTRRIRRPSKLSRHQLFRSKIQKIQVVTFLIQIPYMYTVAARFDRKRRELFAICKAYNNGPSGPSRPSGPSSKQSNPFVDPASDPASDPADPALVPSTPSANPANPVTDPALELHEGRLRIKPCFDEIDTLNMFSIDYTMRICGEKLSHKRLSLLHNCRLRFKSILKLLQKLQELQRPNRPDRHTASRYTASRTNMYVQDEYRYSDFHKNDHRDHLDHHRDHRNLRSHRNYRWKSKPKLLKSQMQDKPQMQQMQQMQMQKKSTNPKSSSSVSDRRWTATTK